MCMNTFLYIVIKFGNLNNFIVFNCTYVYCLLHYMNHVRGTIMSWVSSVISVTGIKAAVFEEGKEVLLLSFFCRSEQKPTQNSFEWVLQLKQPDRGTDYRQYLSTTMNDQPAVTALNVLTAVVQRKLKDVSSCLWGDIRQSRGFNWRHFV